LWVGRDTPKWCRLGRLSLASSFAAALTYEASHSVRRKSMRLGWTFKALAVMVSVSVLSAAVGSAANSPVPAHGGAREAPAGTVSSPENSPTGSEIAPDTRTTGSSVSAAIEGSALPQALTEEERSELSQRAEEPGEEVVGGALSNEHLTYIVIGLAAAVLVLIAK